MLAKDVFEMEQACIYDEARDWKKDIENLWKRKKIIILLLIFS
jgi:hypothetical protein